MRIVVLAPLSPTGGASGGTLVSEDLARALERMAHVERIAAYSFGASYSQSDPWQGALPITLAELRWKGLLRGLVSRQPLSVSRFFRRRLSKSLEERPTADVVFALTPAMWPYAQRMRARRRVLVAFNVEAELYERAVAREANALKRLVWRREARAMNRLEAGAIRDADAVLCLGERDRLALLERYGVAAEPWYPSVPGAERTASRVSVGRVLGMIGTMSWQPNRWGAEWFLREVWPVVRQQVPDAEVRIGGAASEDLEGIEAPGVTALGRVTSLKSFYDGLDVVIAPVRGGGGLKIKVLDASARGLPVVTTSEGVEGMGSRLPTSIDVADDAPAFAAAIAARLRSALELPDPNALAWYRMLTRQGDAAVRRALGLPDEP